MSAAAAQALAGIRARPWRTALTMGGIGAAAAMLGAALTVGGSLRGGFDRSAARAGMPDVIARFDQHDLAAVRGRIGALPNIAAVSYRLEERRVSLSTPGRRTLTSGEVEGTMPGRRGYAIVAGRDLTGRAGEAVVERGLAQAWGVGPGARLTVQSSSPPYGAVTVRIVGVAVAPDNVAYPLASEPRVWMPYAVVRGVFAPRVGAPVNEALIWVRNRGLLDVTLEQARAASYGVGGLTFVTRDGVRILVDQAAGIVVALLAAFALVTLAGAGVMLFASSQAEVQRRLEAMAVTRALGASRRRVVAAMTLEAAFVAAPPAIAGAAAGWAATIGPCTRLLDALDQFAPGWGLLPALAGGTAAIVAIVAAAMAWPAWRACRRPIAPMLRAAELPATPRARGLPRGWVGLGARMMLSRPLRAIATAAVLAATAAVVLLMLALAALLGSLEHDPGAVGLRYQLTTHGSARTLDRVRALPGVAGAGQRFVVDVADSYQLGELFELVAYCGDRLRFESPVLASGRRAVRPGEAEVGLGLAAALGLRPGARLAAQFSDGDEAVFRVVGIVDALSNDGRVAYIQPGRDICRFRGGQTVVQLTPGASRTQVAAELVRRGRSTRAVSAITTSNASFLAALVAVLRTVAIVDGLVCFYAVAQVLALIARERRSAVAVLRACGAGRREVALLFAGAALVVCAAAVPVAVAVESSLLGPATARMAAGYADVSLGASAVDVAIVAAGLGLVAAAAAGLVARAAQRAPIVAGLRAE